MKEIWKDIKGYEGYFQVSNTGKVRSIERMIIFKDGRKRVFPSIIKKPNINRKGYCSVSLTINRNEKRIDIHRLVAIEFINNPDGKPCVNHIDGDKTNNNVENLEWVSYAENTKHALENGLIKSKIGSESSNAKLKDEDVVCIKEMINSNKKIKDISILFNISIRNIYDIKNNKIWKHIQI